MNATTTPAELRAKGLHGTADVLEARLEREAYLRTPEGRAEAEAAWQRRNRALAAEGNDVAAAARAAQADAPRPVRIGGQAYDPDDVPTWSEL